MARLTKTILRQAAAYLSSGHDEVDHVAREFMCHAVREASKWDIEVQAEFIRLLNEHGVDMIGNLKHRTAGTRYIFQNTYKGTPASQAVRFTFLHLLAESL